MKCVQFSQIGEPAEVLKCTEVPPRSPAHGEVRVRMLASPINPSDMMFIRGVYGTKPQLPQIPGFEGVGIVEESGGGLKGTLFCGKQVAVLNKSGGNWADETIVPQSQVIPLSRKLSIGQAACFFVNPATAWIITQEVLKVPQGAWLVQTAATSSLGRMVIRLGKRLGFRTLNIVRRASAVDELKAIGADEVIVFDEQQDTPEELRERLQNVTGPEGLRYAMDPVGGATAAAVAGSLSKHGRLVVFGTLSDQAMQFSPRTLMVRQSSVEGFWLGNFMEQKNLFFKLRLIKRITRLILDGTLATSISETFPLDAITAAVRHAETTASHGKTVLKMNEGVSSKS